MKRFGLLLLITATSAFAQAPIRVYTTPTSPPHEHLERLSLQQAWRIRLKTDGQRDGLATIQLMPGKDGNQLLVQTIAGQVFAVDAESGATLWSTPVGRPYQILQPLTVNSRLVIAVRREQIFVIDRENGKQLLYSVDKDSQLPVLGQALDGVPSAMPWADEDAVHVPFTGRTSCYFLPNFHAALRARPRTKDDAGQLLVPSPQLERLFNVLIDPQQVQVPPFLTNEFLCLACSDGTFLSLNKFTGKEFFRYKVQGPITAAMAQHDTHAYVASEDNHLYAFDVSRGKLVWEVSGSAPILRKVEATDKDVFMTPDRQGLHRVDRKSGAIVWRNRAAERLIACSPKFVFATDRVGNLLVLDHERGTELATLHMRDWIVPISNDLTDRLYFAAHDGSILCLHHRDHRTPFRVKTSPETAFDAKPKPADPGKKPVEPKDDKKDDKKGEMANRARGADISVCPGPGQTEMSAPPSCCSWFGTNCDETDCDRRLRHGEPAQRAEGD